MKDQLTEDERNLWFAVFGAAYVKATALRAEFEGNTLCGAAEANDATFAEESAGLADLAVRDMRETFGPGGGCEGYGPAWFRLGGTGASTSEWHSIADALPEPGASMLIITSEGRRQVATYNGPEHRNLQWTRVEGGVEHVYRPTHWMSLPEPPKTA
jgi:hypothetical protein